MPAPIVHPRSPLDRERFYDGTREIPAKDIMGEVERMMMTSSAAGEAQLELSDEEVSQLGSPVDKSPVPTTFMEREPPDKQTPLVSMRRDNSEPPEFGDSYETTPQSLKRPRVIVDDDEDFPAPKRRGYVPPPTGSYSNKLESIDYDVPPFSKYDTDLRQDWLDKMQARFSEIYKNNLHFPNVELEQNLDPGYMRRQYIRLKNMSDATLIDSWVYRLKVLLLAGVLAFEFFIKKFTHVDIGPFGDICMLPDVMPFFDSALKTLYRKHISGFGTGSMNPFLSLGLVLAGCLVVSVISGYVERHYSGMEKSIPLAIKTFIGFIKGTTTTSGKGKESTSMPEAAGPNTIFGQDPVDMLRKASQFFAGGAPAKKSNENEKPKSQQQRRTSGSNHHSAFAF
jgi:hypothetical protein